MIILLISISTIAAPILLIIAFASLFFPKRFSYGRSINRFRLFGYYALAGFFAFFVSAGLVLSEAPEAFEETEKAAPIETEITHAAHFEPETIGYGLIRSNLQTMTQAQFDDFAEKQIGNILDVSAYVADARKKVFGGYEVWLDVDDPNGLSVQEIYFDADESFALKMIKGQRINCEGIIKNITSVLSVGQVTLRDVECSW